MFLYGNGSALQLFKSHSLRILYGSTLKNYTTQDYLIRNGTKRIWFYGMS